MILQMPRGAIPTPRSDLAASNPYRPETGGTEIFVPSGRFPTPNQELAAAQPYRALGVAPESFLAWPAGINHWGSDTAGNSNWAEEAFAKACAEPKVLIPAEAVASAAEECGSSNFAEFMQTRGFQMDGKAYLDGPFHSVDWTNTAALNPAIAGAGPVKIGIASLHLGSGSQSQITPRTNGWAIYGVAAGQPEDRWASVCGYGALSALADHFKTYGVDVNLPPAMPDGLCYAVFTGDSIGIIDRQSLIYITGEAWVRDPVTIVKNDG